MSRIIEFDGKLYELNTGALSMPLTILRDPYKAPDFAQSYLSRMVSAPMLPNPHAIISIEDTERNEALDVIYSKTFRVLWRRLSRHHLPKRLRKRPLTQPGPAI